MQSTITGGMINFVHATVEDIMSGECNPRAAAAALAYLSAQARYVQAARQSFYTLERLGVIAKEAGVIFGD